MAKKPPRSTTNREQSHAASALTALARLLAREAARDAISRDAGIAQGLSIETPDQRAAPNDVHNRAPGAHPVKDPIS